MRDMPLPMPSPGASRAVPTGWRLAAALVLVYSSLTLSGLNVLLHPGLAYSLPERGMDAVSALIGIALGGGLLQGKRWAYIGTLVLTGLRLLWRLVVLVVGYAWKHYTGVPNPMSLVMLALLVGILALLILSSLPPRSPPVGAA